jgi:hypothetical protein
MMNMKIIRDEVTERLSDGVTRGMGDEIWVCRVGSPWFGWIFFNGKSFGSEILASESE